MDKKQKLGSAADISAEGIMAEEVEAEQPEGDFRPQTDGRAHVPLENE